MSYLRLTDCKHGWLYRIDSRNLTAGVFKRDKNGFVGIRTKLGERFLFVEYHWDTGSPFGTVKPLRPIKRCPIKNLNEYARGKNGKLIDNAALFKWLNEIERK
jgi:hypothetical protein